MGRESILASLADPNRAWIVILVGIVLIYRELVKPGRVLPGMFGALGICAGGYSLFQHPWNPLAAGMIGAALDSSDRRGDSDHRGSALADRSPYFVGASGSRRSPEWNYGVFPKNGDSSASK
jgi:hypothetical protein